MNTPELFSVQKVAKMFGVHPSTIRRWIKLGKLKPINMSSKTIRISEEEVKQLLDK